MSIRQKAKQLEEYYNSFPDWYWKYGLHDAELLSVEAVIDYDDWKPETKSFKTIELFLDSEGAIYESDIESIVLYDCTILSTDIAILELNEYLAENKLWWLGDGIEKKKMNTN